MIECYPLNHCIACHTHFFHFNIPVNVGRFCKGIIILIIWNKCIRNIFKSCEKLINCQRVRRARVNRNDVLTGYEFRVSRHLNGLTDLASQKNYPSFNISKWWRGNAWTKELMNTRLLQQIYVFFVGIALLYYRKSGPVIWDCNIWPEYFHVNLNRTNNHWYDHSHIVYTRNTLSYPDYI